MPALTFRHIILFVERGGIGKLTRFHTRPQPRLYTMFSTWWKHPLADRSRGNDAFLCYSWQRVLGHTVTPHFKSGLRKLKSVNRSISSASAG